MCDGVMFFVIVRFYKERQLRYTIIHYLTMIWSNMFVYTTVDIGYSKKKKTIFFHFDITCWAFITLYIMQLIILLIINNNYQGCYFLMCDGVTFFVIVRLYKERQLRYIIIHYLTMISSNMFVWYYCRHNTCMVSLVYS